MEWAVREVAAGDARVTPLCPPTYLEEGLWLRGSSKALQLPLESRGEQGFLAACSGKHPGAKWEKALPPASWLGLA